MLSSGVYEPRMLGSCRLKIGRSRLWACVFSGILGLVAGVVAVMRGSLALAAAAAAVAWGRASQAVAEEVQQATVRSSFFLSFLFLCCFLFIVILLF